MYRVQLARALLKSTESLLVDPVSNVCQTKITCTKPVDQWKQNILLKINKNKLDTSNWDQIFN